ncbi:hypothetical protein Rahaq_5094 (plasmid) [Rahnella aceris]|uniref:DUF4354 domain-containing protein n=1 Tax=Rahnella sp. (strain Y9602) TaxID=2703885 RepID=A0A0H3FIS9_RAHSY|nr:DUF4354 family protein [Rahnella aceris]ADW76665.1 hypothetical protein Rahaq_5094 [Rahnella aceris]
MKMSYVICSALLALTTISAHASPVKTPDLRIDAFKKEQGALAQRGELLYEVVFDVNVANLQNEDFKMPKSCFILSDEKGNKVVSSGISANLLMHYGGLDSKEGIVMFTSKDKNIYDMSLVRWSSTGCQSNTAKG